MNYNGIPCTVNPVVAEYVMILHLSNKENLADEGFEGGRQKDCFWRLWFSEALVM